MYDVWQNRELLKCELSDLLAMQPGCMLLLNTLATTYKATYKKTLALSRFGFKRGQLEVMVEALDMFTFEGLGPNKKIMLKLDEFLTDLKNNVKTLLFQKSKTSKTLNLSRLVPLYKEWFNRDFNIKQVLLELNCQDLSSLIASWSPEVCLDKRPSGQTGALIYLPPGEISKMEDMDHGSVDDHLPQKCTFFLRGQCRFGQYCFNIH